jgi:hypothetical protein
VRPDEVVKQRQLTGVQVVLKDARWYAKYVLPFFNIHWRVPFIALDVLGRPPTIWDRDVKYGGREIQIKCTAGEMMAAPPIDAKRFEGLLHFDPWWAFKGAGFPPDLVRAVLPTNVAGRTHRLDVPRTVADVAFDRTFQFLVAVEAEDEHFGRKTFSEGTLELGKLRA